MKYIDADKLKAEIERRRLQNRYIDTDGYEQELFEIIDSLQREQQEADLEKEISTWIPAHISGGDNEVWRDTKKVVTEWAGIVAHHFYELGKNSR